MGRKQPSKRHATGPVRRKATTTTISSDLRRYWPLLVLGLVIAVIFWAARSDQPESQQSEVTATVPDEARPAATKPSALDSGSPSDVAVATPASIDELRASGEFRSEELQLSQSAAKDGYALYPAKPNWIKSADEQTPNGTLWWKNVDLAVRQRATASDVSNVCPEDYAGPESCRQCHQEKYDSWSNHAHRWMNAWATEETVKGDFSGTNSARIEYMGGVGTFYRDENGQYLMRLKKNDQERLYKIVRTIGSRFFQYYSGTMMVGPEPDDHPSRSIDYVLPFGYWLDQERWVPLVHVAGHVALDGDREDPYIEPCREAYDATCGICHTTKPAGDWMLTRGGSTRVQAHAPHKIDFFASDYIEKSRPEIVSAVVKANAVGKGTLSEQVMQTLEPFGKLPAKDYTVCLGVSCESCHNGAKFHVDQKELAPKFFFAGAQVFASDSEGAEIWGRSPDNLNWTCAKCHSGSRPAFANGADTWNSTEYSDAVRGACYLDSAGQSGKHTLTCVHCHEPHTTIGKKWANTPAEDNASCTACHEQFQDAAALTAHTHHAPESSGSDCMNCHMPKINEGLQDVVRTHRIFSPNEPSMIHANQPNACNLCHVDETIDWTITHLKDWFGSTYDEQQIAENYPHREAPATMGWLGRNHAPTRLAAIDAVSLSKTPWGRYAVHLLLDDPAIINRQIAQLRLENEYDVPLESEFGYRFYMTKDERAPHLRAIRKALLETEQSAASKGQP